MIPKIDVQVPEIFIRSFYHARNYGPREKLDSDIRNFREFIEQNGERILTEIARLSGFEWSKERIPVYLFPESTFGPRYSFCTSELEDGLPGILQKIGMPQARVVHIHIHELAHANQWQGGWKEYLHKANGERNTDLTELGADIVALYVVKNIFGENSEYEKDLWDFMEKTSEKNKRKGEILKKYADTWDLNKNTLKYYLEGNKSILDNIF